MIVGIYISLLLAILLDTYLSIFKLVGQTGSINRLSPLRQAIFWLVQFALAIAYAIASVGTFGYLLGFLLAGAGIVFGFVFYIASLKFFLKTKMRRENQQRMAAFEAEFQASQRKE